MLRFLLIPVLAVTAQAADPIRVLVWDERQPRQAEAYDNFLGNEIASRLSSRPGLQVQSAGLDDPDQGLGSLDEQDVLFWWGHVRQGEISAEAGQRIVERIRAGKLGFVALHSAHWATPFMEAMFARTREDAKRRFPHPDTKLEFVPPPGQFQPTYDSIVTPAYYAFIQRGVVTRARVDLPNCVFPAFDNHGKPSRVTVTMPDHPIMQGVPARFELERTEMYDEPFHVPAPDAVLFREDWAGGGPGGGWFRGAMVWTLGQGRVVYFRPGHEQYPIFKDERVLTILENAARWLGALAQR